MKKKQQPRHLEQKERGGILKRRWPRRLISGAVCLVLALSCLAAFRSTGNTLRDQSMAREWAGGSGMNYAQVSVFLPEENTLDEGSIYTFRETVDAAILDQVTEEIKHPYVDAWSTKGAVSVRGDHGSADASVIAAGGNFFQLHPLTLRSGSYFSGDDLMHDRVILDEELAWKLFGGYDLAGMTVEINDRTFQVAGVIARESDWATEAAYADGGGLYLSYDAYQALDETASMSCYEIIMPNPVEGFAVQQVTEHLAPKDAQIVENSSRYTISGIFSLMGDFSQRTIRSDGISYPYWENAARLVENRCMVWLLLAMVLGLWPAVLAAVLAALGLRAGKRKLRTLWADVKDQYENRVLWDNLKAKRKGSKHGGSDAEKHQKGL